MQSEVIKLNVSILFPEVGRTVTFSTKCSVFTVIVMFSLVLFDCCITRKGCRLLAARTIRTKCNISLVAMETSCVLRNKKNNSVILGEEIIFLHFYTASIDSPQTLALFLFKKKRKPV